MGFIRCVMLHGNRDEEVSQVTVNFTISGVIRRIEGGDYNVGVTVAVRSGEFEQHQVLTIH